MKAIQDVRNILVELLEASNRCETIEDTYYLVVFAEQHIIQLKESIKPKYTAITEMQQIATRLDALSNKKGIKNYYERI